MARSIPCDSEDGQPAAYVIGDTTTGEQLFLCGPCTIQWAALLVQAVGGVPAEHPPDDGSGEGEDGEPVEDSAGVPPPAESESETPLSLDSHRQRRAATNARRGASDKQ
ncbi:MAG TPA: hypothetical protein VNF75_03575 [Candidatus Dormibacteraeota bacterium]|nr:hypothetical protein [Candidatus Dormibacteraeota bacterium]